MNKTALVIYSTKENRYSFNALLGALESTEEHTFMDVFFYDPKKSDESLLDDCVARFEHVVFAFSFFTTQVWDVYRFLIKVKEKYANRIVFIAGGPHATGEPKATLDMGFNYVMIGEGEELINDFFHAVRQDDDLGIIAGVYSKTEQGYRYTARKGTVDLNSFLPFSEKYRKFGPIEITRGCPFACNFCQTTRIFGCSVRHRSIETIEGLLQILKRNGLKDFRAITPNALAYGSTDGKRVDLDAVQGLLSAIKFVIPEGRIFLGSFPSEVRPEHVTEESMSLLCDYVSNDNIIIGAQTGSQRLLDLSHRGHRVSDVYSAVEIALDFNMLPNVDFMFGLPGETQDDIYQSITVMNDLIKMGARIHAHTFMPLPQTPFAQKGRGKVNDEMRRYIRTHVSQGAIYGDWAEQAKQSQRIEKLLKTKKVDLNDI